MNFYEWEAAVRALVFGGVFLAALFATLWVWYDTAGSTGGVRWLWRLVGSALVLVTIPAVVLGAANLDQDRESLLNILGWASFGAGLLAILTAGAYSIWGRVAASPLPPPVPAPIPVVASTPTVAAPRLSPRAAAPAEPAKSDAYMFVKAGPDKGKQYPLANLVTIGRSSSCELTLSDRRISSEHAQVKREGEAFVFLDLRSTNGSFLLVDGQERPLTTAQSLVHGDEIRLGHTVLEFIDTRAGGAR